VNKKIEKDLNFKGSPKNRYKGYRKSIEKNLNQIQYNNQINNNNINNIQGSNTSRNIIGKSESLKGK
jgi:hypothetical protein